MESHGNSYVAFVLAQSRAHREAILGLPLSPEVAQRFARLAEESVAEQRRIEAADTVPFETYRQQYLSPVRLNR
jgi:glutamate--cysteine ligase